MADREATVAELAALSSSATSPDGTVSLAVNTDGVMTRLRLSNDVSRLSPAEIADVVMETYVRALRESAERTAELMVPLGIGGYLAERLKWRMRFEPAPQAVPVAPVVSEPDEAVLKDRSETPGATPAPSGPTSDDEWYGQGVRFKPAW